MAQAEQSEPNPSIQGGAHATSQFNELLLPTPGATGTQGLSSWRALSWFACKTVGSFAFLSGGLSEDVANQNEVEAREGGREAC